MQLPAAQDCSRSPHNVLHSPIVFIQCLRIICSWNQYIERQHARVLNVVVSDSDGEGEEARGQALASLLTLHAF